MQSTDECGLFISFLLSIAVGCFLVGKIERVKEFVFAKSQDGDEGRVGFDGEFDKTPTVAQVQFEGAWMGHESFGRTTRNQDDASFLGVLQSLDQCRFVG